jgi:hypothetical protein
MGEIEDLQRDAFDAAIRVSTLLQRCLALAVKLNTLGTAPWIEKELNGYQKGDTIPDYRITRGSLQARDITGRWVEAHFNASQQEPSRVVETIPAEDPIAQLETLIALNTSTTVVVQLGDVPLQELQRVFKVNTEFRVEMPPGTLEKVTAGVRTQIVKWLATLQRDQVSREQPTSLQPAKPQPAPPISNTVPQGDTVFSGTFHNPTFHIATSGGQQTVTSGAAPLVSKGGWLSELRLKIVKSIPEAWIAAGLIALGGFALQVFHWIKGWIQTLLQ